MRLCFIIFFLFFFSGSFFAGVGDSLVKIKVIEGKISPKSVVHSGNGMFFAQNMMYRHTITVYDRSFNLVKTISDKIELNKFGFPQYKGSYRGAPVECAFSSEGKYAWVSNYYMSGGEEDEFTKPGCDDCSAKGKYDSSFVYKINTENLEIESVVKVGAVPKYLAVTPDNKYLLVTNWSSGDLSVVDIAKETEVKRIRLGTFPRGIIVSKNGKTAYVAIMGSDKIAVIDLVNFTKTYIEDIGKSPRHLCLSPDGKALYASMNGEGRIAKIQLSDYSVQKVKTGRLPRSMEISEDGKFLYVVNYGSNELSKVDTRNMSVLASVETNDKPIGVTFDQENKNIWVACYEGSLMVFHDSYYDLGDTLTIAEDFVVHQRPKIDLSVEGRRKEKEDKIIEDNSAKEEETEENNFLLVTGSFLKKENAAKKVKELISSDYPAFVYYNPENNFTYACAAGFKNKKEAIEEAKKMKEKGESVWVFGK